MYESMLSNCQLDIAKYVKVVCIGLRTCCILVLGVVSNLPLEGCWVSLDSFFELNLTCSRVCCRMELVVFPLDSLDGKTQAFSLTIARLCNSGSIQICFDSSAPRHESSFRYTRNLHDTESRSTSLIRLLPDRPVQHVGAVFAPPHSLDKTC